jgi:hypothetical protein
MHVKNMAERKGGRLAFVQPMRPVTAIFVLFQRELTDSVVKWLTVCSDLDTADGRLYLRGLLALASTCQTMRRTVQWADAFHTWLRPGVRSVFDYALSGLDARTRVSSLIRCRFGPPEELGAAIDANFEYWFLGAQPFLIVGDRAPVKGSWSGSRRAKFACDRMDTIAPGETVEVYCASPNATAPVRVARVARWPLVHTYQRQDTEHEITELPEWSFVDDDVKIRLRRPYTWDMAVCIEVNSDNDAVTFQSLIMDYERARKKQMGPWEVPASVLL